MPNKMLDIIRYALYAILIYVGMLLFQAWEADHPKAVSQIEKTSSTSPTSYVPTLQPAQAQTNNQPSAQDKKIAPSHVAAGKIIHVKTDLLSVDIDSLGGNIIQVKLLKYPETLHSADPVVLLNNNAETRYIAQSGLISEQGPDSATGQVEYTADQTDYALADNASTLNVNLTWSDEKGIKITKTYTFNRGSYETDLTYAIDNSSTQNWDGNLYLQIMRKNNPPSSSGFVNSSIFYGAAVSSPDKPFKKIPFKDMLQTQLNQTIQGGWAAMVQHYFVSAWVPAAQSTSQYFSRVTDDGLYTIGMVGPKLSIAPGHSMTTQAKFYAGPSVAKNLEKLSPTLSLAIDYGWFWLIAVAIFWMMQHIYNLIGNWGWSIVLVTVIIKLMFYHLSAKSYRSMSMLKNLQPKIAALKERFGDDKQKFTQATLELYKKEKVNPMSGCLPILIQIPVFIGLYSVLVESVELRQAPFILWIHDLTLKDPYYVLPLLMGISMFLQQRLNPPPADPMQAKMMMLMPVVFTFLFINFPSGLMLYWFVNNSLSFLQQWYIMRSINKNANVITRSNR